MDAERVVPMNCEIYLGHQLAQGLEAFWVSELRFELSIEGFLITVLPGTTWLAAGDADAGAFKKGAEGFGTILNAVVAVEDERALMRKERICECGGHEGCTASRPNGDADDIPRVYVHGCGDTDVFVKPGEMREVSDPRLVLV